MIDVLKAMLFIALFLGGLYVLIVIAAGSGMP